MSNSPSTAPGLSSEQYQAGTEAEAVEQLIEGGYTDGLPVIPPTPERTESMLQSVDPQPDDILGTIPERHRIITAEKAAINAVMAGCKPEVFPVVIAAVRAVCDPRFSVHGPTATTAGTAILIVVNGPIVEERNFRKEANLFAPGNRSNATVGRALNLILRNVGGANLDEFDRACFSHPGRYTYCIAENENVSPWTPFHVQRGFDESDSTVTVFAGDAPNQIANNSGKTPRSVLSTIAGRMASPGILGLGFDSEVVVIIGREHMKTILRKDYSKRDVQEFLADNASLTMAEIKRSGMLPGDVEEGEDEIDVPLVDDPDNIFVLTAGGQAGPFSAFIPGWTGRDNCEAVTVGIPGHASEAACELPEFNGGDST